MLLSSSVLVSSPRNREPAPFRRPVFAGLQLRPTARSPPRFPSGPLRPSVGLLRRPFDPRSRRLVLIFASPQSRADSHSHPARREAPFLTGPAVAGMQRGPSSQVSSNERLVPLLHPASYFFAPQGPTPRPALCRASFRATLRIRRGASTGAPRATRPSANPPTAPLRSFPLFLHAGLLVPASPLSSPPRSALFIHCALWRFPCLPFFFFPSPFPSRTAELRQRPRPLRETQSPSKPRLSRSSSTRWNVLVSCRFVPQRFVPSDPPGPAPSRTASSSPQTCLCSRTVR